MTDGSGGPGGLSRRQYMLLAAAGGLGTMGVASGLDQDGESGMLTAGNMALSQAYNVAGSLWVGPDSAKGNVSADSGRMYFASDTQLTYYGDGGSWVSLGVGTSGNKAPASHFQSLTTEGVKYGTPTEVHTTSSLATSGSGTDADPYIVDFANDVYGTLPGGSRLVFDGIVEPNSPPVNHNTGLELHGLKYDRNGCALRLPDGANSDLIHLNKGFGFRKMFFIGNKANNTGDSGCVVLKSRVVNSYIDQVSVVEYDGPGWLQEDDGFAWQIRGLYSENHNGDGFATDATNGKLSGSHWFGGYLYNNGGRGLHIPSGGLLSASTLTISVVDNADNGIEVAQGSGSWATISGETNSNGDRGAHITGGGINLIDLTAEDNDTDGINSTGNGNVVAFCRAIDNNRGTGNGNGDGIVVAGSESLAIGNIAQSPNNNHNNGLVFKGTDAEAWFNIDKGGDGTFIGGTRQLENGMGEEAASGTPTAANWPVGAVVEDTNNAGDLYMKAQDGTFEQIST